MDKFVRLPGVQSITIGTQPFTVREVQVGRRVRHAPTASLGDHYRVKLAAYRITPLYGQVGKRPHNTPQLQASVWFATQPSCPTSRSPAAC